MGVLGGNAECRNPLISLALASGIEPLTYALRVCRSTAIVKGTVFRGGDTHREKDTSSTTCQAERTSVNYT